MKIQCIATSCKKALDLYYRYFYKDYYSDMEAFKVKNGSLRYFLCYPESFHLKFSKLLNENGCDYVENSCLDMNDEVYLMKSNQIEKELREE